MLNGRNLDAPRADRRRAPRIVSSHPAPSHMGPWRRTDGIDRRQRRAAVASSEQQQQKKTT